MSAIHTLKAQKRSKMLQDFILLAIIFVISFCLFSSFDVLEWLVEFAHQHEGVEIDELISSSIVLCFLFAIFSYRRWQDVKELSLYCEELSMIDPITLLPNRRVITRLLDDVREGKNKQPCFPLSLILVNINGLEDIQSQLGNTVAEQAIHELVYRYSMLLGPDQLISYRNASQCLIFCPKLSHALAKKLCDAIDNVELEGRKSTLQMLRIDAVAITLSQAAELDWAFERLEDDLHETIIKRQNEQPQQLDIC